MLKLREMNPGCGRWTWALAIHEGEEKPAIYIHSRVPSLPSSVSKSLITISLATVRNLPCRETYCPSHQIHWACTMLCKLTGTTCELVVPLSATLWCTLQRPGNSWRCKIVVAHPLSPVKSSLSSSEEGRGSWARGDGCWEAAADRSTAGSEHCCSSFPCPSSPPEQGGQQVSPHF